VEEVEEEEEGKEYCEVASCRETPVATLISICIIHFFILSLCQSLFRDSTLWETATFARLFFHPLLQCRIVFQLAPPRHRPPPDVLSQFLSFFFVFISRYQCSERRIHCSRIMRKVEHTFIVNILSNDLKCFCSVWRL
jgi:hypothetical protein